MGPGSSARPPQHGPSPQISRHAWVCTYTNTHVCMCKHTHVSTCPQAHMHTHGNVEEGVTETRLGQEHRLVLWVCQGQSLPL